MMITLLLLLLLFCVCVCVCLCVCLCVYVCVCVCVYFLGFPWLNKSINVMPDTQVSIGILRKYFGVKYLCRHVIDNHNRNLQACNCSKEWQLNRAEPRDIKDNSYKLSKRQWYTRKVQLSSSSQTEGAILTQHKGKYCRTTTTATGVL